MKRTDRRLWLVLFLLAVGLCLATAGWGDLYNETDGQYGAAAKTMAQGGSWGIPENDGIPRLVKPPLLYWTMAVSMKIFGVNAFAARLPSAVALVAWVLLTAGIGTRMGGAWRGFLAGGILLTWLGLFTLGRIVMPEPMFAAFIAAALYCLLCGWEQSTRRTFWDLGFWLCAALASFTKGPHGLLYPLLIVGGAVLLHSPARHDLRGLISWWGLGLFLVINLPWYLYVESQFPGWTANLFFTEQLGHVVGNAAPATDYSIVPRWQFLLLHTAWFFPWSLVAGVVIFQSWIHAPADAPQRIGRSLRNTFPAALVTSWAVVVLVSVLLAGQRQDYYAMAMWPAVALGMAALIENRSLRPAAMILTLVLFLGFLTALFLPWLPLAAPSGAGTATVADRATAWTTLTNFDLSVWHHLSHTALWSLGLSALGAAIASVLTGRKQVFALLAAASALALGAISGFSSVSPYFSLARVAPFLTANASPESRLIYDGGLDSGSSLLFYTDLPVTWLDQNPAEDFITRKFGIGRKLFLTTPEFLKIWNSSAPIFLVTEGSKLTYWQKVTGFYLVPVAQCGTQIILKN